MKYTVVGLADGQRIATWVEADNYEEAEQIAIDRYENEGAGLEIAGVFLGELLAVDA